MASFFRSFAAVGSNTMISRILGFTRDLVLARMFGADATTDAFFVAFKIPNFLRRLFAEGAFSLAFVPVLTEYRTKGTQEELQDFVNKMAGTLGTVLLVATAIGVLAAPVLVFIFAPGFWFEDEGKYHLAVDMLYLTFPYLFFISLTAFSGGILNTHNRFGAAAFTPALLNISLIVCALWLSQSMEVPVKALAWGVLFAGVVQFTFQIPFLHQLRLIPRPRVAFKDPGVVKVMKLMVPALFGVSVSQLNLLLDTLIASFLVSGSISWLYYSDRLMEFPVGILAVALGTVILPNLSRKHSEKSSQEFSDTLDWALRVTLLLGIPSAIGLLLLAGPMLATLFYSEAFNEHDVSMATLSLMAYAPGLLAIMLIKILAPGFYARQDTRTPVRIGIIAMVANMVFNIALVFPLAHAGLALATTCSSALNAYLLYRGLRKDNVLQPRHGLTSLLVRSLIAGGTMAVFLVWIAGDLDYWLGISFWARIQYLILWIGCAAAIYFLSLLLMGVRPRDFRSVKH
ncbi:MAG: murein biosynthesis integral membrane protein MurJ [Candidatus Thiodiazotropha sp. (ex Notomyrtea botanica)]|nr:murein biosynthesis integral membrane protein MurJ [Candidatus Thiodiazotropha sp. (ex Notomyrtea botanica)]